MQYCSAIYLAVFLPITLLVYALTAKKKRWLVLLIASYIFFLSLSGKLIVYLLFSTLSIHHFGLWIDKINKNREKEDKYDSTVCGANSYWSFSYTKIYWLFW